MEQKFETKNQEREAKMKVLQEKLDKAYAEKGNEVHEKVSQFIGNLRNKYPNWGQYGLYHLLALSGPSEPCPKFDFPGKDSVEKFINSL